MHPHRTILLALWISVISSIPVLASESYVVSAAVGTKLILKVLEFDQRKINVKQSVTIEADHEMIGTAVTPRTINGIRVFDVSLATCRDANDLFCDFPSLSVLRVDANLNVQSRKDYDIPTWSVSVQRLKKPKTTELRVLLYDGYKPETSERILLKDGSISTRVLNVNSTNTKLDATASEDGKMAASALGLQISVWPLHPTGPIKRMISSDPAESVALSGPVLSGSESYRYLFYRTHHGLETTLHPTSRVMFRKLNSSTGKFVSESVAFTNKKLFDWDFTKNVDISGDGNIVLYTEKDEVCSKTILLAQAFDPVKGKKSAPASILIGCDDMPTRFDLGVRGIDIGSVIRQGK